MSLMYKNGCKTEVFHHKSIKPIKFHLEGSLQKQKYYIYYIIGKLLLVD